MKIVDTIKTTYKELFTVALLHPVYETIYTYKDPVTNADKTITASAIFNVLSVEPDTATKKLMANHSMCLRCSNNIVSCFTRAQSQHMHIPLPNNTHIRLLLKNKSDFLYRTNIIAAGSSHVYWFSNSKNTLDSGIKYITTNATGVTDADLEGISTLEVEENCFGVIDMLSNVTDVNYRLLNGDIMESPAFSIRFILK